MYTREYLISLFFPAQRPYWFVSVLLRNPIPFPPKNIETEVEMNFFPSVSVANYGATPSEDSQIGHVLSA